MYIEIWQLKILDYHESFYCKKNKARRKELVKLLKLNENKKIEDFYH